MSDPREARSRGEERDISRETRSRGVERDTASRATHPFTTPLLLSSLPAASAVGRRPGATPRCSATGAVLTAVVGGLGWIENVTTRRDRIEYVTT